MKTLLHNGKVFLGKGRFADSTGFDSVSGKIIFIGNSWDTEFFTDKGYPMAKPAGHVCATLKEYDEVIDLKGKLVLPAFTDGHCHLYRSSQVNSELNLRKAKTKKDFTDAINSYRKTLKSGDWLIGGYFTQANFKEDVRISKDFIDAICPDIPVLIFRCDLHSVFANSKAIELSGIESKLGEFHSDEVVRNSAGNITGEFKEAPMYHFLYSIPEKSLEEKLNALKKEISKLHRFGICAVSDISLPPDVELYRELINRNELKLRINSQLPFVNFPDVEKYRSNFKDYEDLIGFRSFKAFYDGSLTSETGYFKRNYKNKNYNGLRTDLVLSGDFRKIAFEIDKAGYQMTVHAIGDKAVSDLLDLNEELILIHGKKNRRFRIEHAQHIDSNDLDRFANCEVVVSVQPSHLASDAIVAGSILENPESTHIFSELMKRGVRVCFGTDFPVVEENPFDTIYYAMTRKAEGFPHGFYPEYSVSLEDCIEAYTINNAYASFEENTRGSIEKGKFADLIITDNMFEMTPEEIKNIIPAMTYFGGECVRDKE